MIPLLLFLAGWLPQQSNGDASLRGISAPSASIAWASGTKGTCLLTKDGGKTWKSVIVPEAEKLDFRDVQAFDAQTAYLLSSGSGELSRIYKTTDGGEHWTLQFTNQEPKGFFDSFAFWDRNHGIIIGDPLNGHLDILTTTDGGNSWKRTQGPAANLGEGAFAASGTAIAVAGKQDAWFGTGGARVFHSRDGGRSWSVAQTPLRHDSASAGIFSIAFRDRKHGAVVGGDYRKPKERTQSAAVTSDGGKTWQATPSMPGGFRSVVAFLPEANVLVVAGTSGSDWSKDSGKTWQPLANAAGNALAFASGKAGWLVGAKGQIFSWDGAVPVH